MKFWHKLTLQTKMAIFIVILVLFQMSVIAYYSTNLISNLLEDQIGQKSLNVSRTVSKIPAIKKWLQQQDPHGNIQTLSKSIQKTTGAQFVVIGDINGKRYAHPKNDRLGKYMVGGDNDDALIYGKSYISTATGTLGPSLRGKAPIFDDKNNIIGIVSVGYLQTRIKAEVGVYQKQMLILTILLIITGIIAAIFMSRGFKRAILGLEPVEIGRLFKEKNAILESIREGIIAINNQGYITTINQAAAQTIGIKPAKQLLKKHISLVLPNTGMLRVLKSGKSKLDSEHFVGKTEIIVNRVPVIHDGKVIGAVSSFRKKNEIDTLAKELSRVQEYTKMLKNQTHEHANKLHTIAGLIQLEAYEEAIELISHETSDYQELIEFLSSSVPDTIISGAILGKYNRAKELNVQLTIVPESNFSDVPEWISREKIVTILGNLLDNAFEIVLAQPSNNRKVNLSFTDFGNDLVLEVEDSGKGVAKNIQEIIFKRNFSTSDEIDKGIGLYLVRQELEYLNGHLVLGKSDLGGALFSVFIPKEQK